MVPVLCLHQLLNIHIFRVTQNPQLFQEAFQLLAELFRLERFQIMNPGGAFIGFADGNLRFGPLVANRVKCLAAFLKFCPLCVPQQGSTVGFVNIELGDLKYVD